MWNDLLRPLAVDTPIVPSPGVKPGRVSPLALLLLCPFCHFPSQVLLYEVMWVDGNVGVICLILTVTFISSPWDGVAWHLQEGQAHSCSQCLLSAVLI